MVFTLDYLRNIRALFWGTLVEHGSPFQSLSDSVKIKVTSSKIKDLMNTVIP